VIGRKTVAAAGQFKESSSEDQEEAVLAEFKESMDKTKD